MKAANQTSLPHKSHARLLSIIWSHTKQSRVYAAFIQRHLKMTLETMTRSLLTTLLPPSSTPPILYENRTINSSDQSWQNNTASTLIQPQGLAMSSITMIFGTVSNLTALGILAKSRVRFRHQFKTPFLLLTVALLLADLGGHVIPGAFALDLHIKSIEPTPQFCHVFGACMVFFGLCPLLFGCALAVERCVAITQPFFHASTVTVAHMWRVVLILSSLAFVLAVLPFFKVGTYITQFPGKWCFLPVHGSQTTADISLALAFSCLGLIALIISVLCNILSGLALLQGRIKSHNSKTQPGVRRTHRGSSVSSSSSFCSLDVEVLAQLAMVTVVSCVCWGPFLIRILVAQLSQIRASAVKEGFFLLPLRIASWNQILDPWVYILLRRAVLSKVCRRRCSQRSTVNCSYTRYKPPVCSDHVSLEVFSYDQK